MKKLLVILSMIVAMNASAQWVQMSNGLPGNVAPLIIKGNNIFAGTFNNLNNGIYLSTNFGTSWNQTTLNNLPVWSLAVIGNNIVAGTGGNGVLFSTNNGTSWIQSSLTGKSVHALTVLGNNIFAGTYESGVYISTNYGVAWTQAGLASNEIISLTICSNNLFAGTSANGVYKSTNNGINWNQTSLNNKYVSSLAADSNTVYAGTTTNGIYISTNSGLNWSLVGLNDKSISSLTINGSNIFAGTSINGVYMSTNKGVNWIQKNQGFILMPVEINCFLIVNNYIHITTYGDSFWRRSLSEIIGIQNIGTEIPSMYSLSQNYPNPFNPTTKIRFDVSIFPSGRRSAVAEGVPEGRGGFVTLKVYDVTGREVRTLVNERLQPGTYETTFDGSRLNSGVYFYKLITNGFTETKKMLLLK